MKMVTAIFIAAMLMFCRCGNGGGPLAGGGSPSPNALTGRVLHGSASSVSLYTIERATDSDTATLVWRELRHTTTDDSGKYSIDTIPDGYYSILVTTNDGLSGFSGYFHLDSTSRLYKVKDIKPSSSKSVSGHITDPSDKPVVTIIGLVGTPFSDTSSSTDGSFNFSALPDANFQMQVISTGTYNTKTTHGILLIAQITGYTGNMTVSELASSGDSVIVDSVGAEIHVPWLITDNNTNAPYFTLSEEIITYNSDSYKIEYTIKP